MGAVMDEDDELGSQLADIADRLERIADALEELAKPPDPPENFVFVEPEWRRIDDVNTVSIDPSKPIIVDDDYNVVNVVNVVTDEDNQ